MNVKHGSNVEAELSVAGIESGSIRNQLIDKLEQPEAELSIFVDYKL